MTVEHLIDIAALHFQVERSRLVSSCRLAPIVRARHISILVASELLGISQGEIGKAFGRSAPAVSCAIKHAKDFVGLYPSGYGSSYKELKGKLHG